MEQKIDMIVNRLPAKTWNRLSVNQAEIKDLTAGKDRLLPSATQRMKSQL